MDSRLWRWRVWTCSVRGASHVRQQLRNQDAAAHWIAGDEPQQPVVLAVADGHGSDKSFRSHVGSDFAVSTAIDMGREFVRETCEATLSEVKQAAEQRLPLLLTKSWQEKIAQHWAEHPLTAEELDRWPVARQLRQRMFNSTRSVSGETLAAGHSPTVSGAAVSAGHSPEKVDPESPVASAMPLSVTAIGRELPVPIHEILRTYGSTLLVIIADHRSMLCLQLGDGDMLAVQDDLDDGLSVSRPIERDETSIANETNSLCQLDAAKRFNVRFSVFGERTPALLLACTDGYSNAFESPTGFEQVGPDLCRALRHDGVAALAAELPGELERVSALGSGDDVTAGFIFREDIPV
ncbi:MAG: protein phosphatase 2C domain-containing protein [Planctomycetaceae bacterium]